MSRRFPRCSSVRPVGPSRKSDHFGSSESQCFSIPHIIVGYPLIHGSPGQLISITWERSGTKTGSAGTSLKQEKWSLHQEWSSTVQAAHPSYFGICVPHLSLALISGNCRYLNPSVFTFLTVHLGTLVTRKFTMIWESHSLPTASDL